MFATVFENLDSFKEWITLRATLRSTQIGLESND